MKALIAFIGMAVLILTLIEINERLKKKRNQESGGRNQESGGRNQESGGRNQDCPDTACTDCSLIDICDKEEKKSPRKK